MLWFLFLFSAWLLNDETDCKPNTYVCTKALLKYIIKQSWEFVTESSDVNCDYKKLISNIMTSIDLS